MKKNLNGPVIHLDPITLEPTCSPSDCKNKFTNKVSEVRTMNFVWVGGPVTYSYHQSLCNECYKRIQTSEDKKLTSESIRRAKLNRGVDPQVENAEQQ